MANLKYIRFNTLRFRAAFLFKCCARLKNQYSSPDDKSLINNAINKCFRYISGAEGEERTLGIPKHQPGCLTELPNQYIIFNQLMIRYNRAIRELDYLVLGPKGIFVLEVKNNQGVIEGNDTDELWLQYKDHNKFNPIQIRNPVKQVQSTANVFQRTLAAHDIHVDLLPVVVYSHPNCTLIHQDNSIPVLRLSELSNHILTSPTRSKPDDIQKIYACLSHLYKKRLGIPITQQHFEYHSSEANPKHISYFMKDFVHNRVEDIINHKRQFIHADVNVMPFDITSIQEQFQQSKSAHQTQASKSDYNPAQYDRNDVLSDLFKRLMIDDIDPSHLIDTHVNPFTNNS